MIISLPPDIKSVTIHHKKDKTVISMDVPFPSVSMTHCPSLSEGARSGSDIHCSEFRTLISLHRKDPDGRTWASWCRRLASSACLFLVVFLAGRLIVRHLSETVVQQPPFAHNALPPEERPPVPSSPVVLPGSGPKSLAPSPNASFGLE